MKDMALWNEGDWIAAIAVGVLVLGLLIWSITVYRRRDGECTIR